MARKPDAIDLLKLYADGDHKLWNTFLTNCLQKHDLNKLAETRKRLQAGMAIVAKKKMNTEKLILFFLRLQSSIENTVKKIVRETDPNPCDDPMKAVKHLEHKGEKKIRDNEMETFLKKTGY